MKKLILKNLLGLLILFATGLTFEGCSTPPTRVAVQIVGTENALVKGAMKLWADYSNAGNTTQVQIDKVKSLYAKFKALAKLEQTALASFQSNPEDEPAFNVAHNAVLASQAELLDFIHLFVK